MTPPKKEKIDLQRDLFEEQPNIKPSFKTDLAATSATASTTPKAFLQNEVKEIKGNRGEWSEVYVFLRLLSDGFMIERYQDLSKKMKEKRQVVVNVIRQHPKPVLYHVPAFDDPRHDKDHIYIREGDNQGGFKPTSSLKIPKIEFQIACSELERTLMESESENGGITIPESHPTIQLIRKLKWTSIKAPSDSKSDLKITLSPDPKRTSETTHTYSIKSAMGGAATLFNADKSSNFDYTILPKDPKGRPFNAEDADRLNAINKGQKIKDRMKFLSDNGFKLVYSATKSPVFSDNLRSASNGLESDKIIQAMLLKYFHSEKTDGEKRLTELKEFIPFLSETDPLGFKLKYADKNRVEQTYKQSLKTLLSSMALGMTACKPFDPEKFRDEVTGGILLLQSNESGKPTTYAHSLTQLNQLEEYLFNNTKLETGSTTRHEFAQAYLDKTNGEYRMSLNLQIRFVEEKPEKKKTIKKTTQAKLF